MKQKMFLKDYTERLHGDVKNHDISAYRADGFEYDAECLFNSSVERPDDLLQQMMPYATSEGDFMAAKILFEAFPDLTREQAQYRPFWAYLSLVDLYPYMIKRFCNGEAPTETDILNHWWHSNLMRNGLSNLWWSVKQSGDPIHPSDKYHYTKYLFDRIDFRQRRMGSSTLFRHKEAVLGILQYLEDNVKDYFEGRSNFIMMYFNKQATLKQLAAWDRNDFYNELKSIESDIMKVKDRTEAAGMLSTQDDDEDDEIY